MLGTCGIDGIVDVLIAALGDVCQLAVCTRTVRHAVADHWWRRPLQLCRYRDCRLADDRIIRGVSSCFGRSPLHYGCAQTLHLALGPAFNPQAQDAPHPLDEWAKFRESPRFYSREPEIDRPRYCFSLSAVVAAVPSLSSSSSFVIIVA